MDGNNISIIPKGIGEDLVKEFAPNNLLHALKEIGVVEDKATFASFKDISAWKRGGGETYIAIAEVGADFTTKKFIAKAIVTSGIRPEEQMKNWLRRREILKSEGINVPHLYSAKGGVIYEELLERNFVLQNETSVELLRQAARIASTLDRLGFATLSFTSDLMVRKNLLYYVDFGFDLGEPSNSSKTSALEHLQQSTNPEQLEFVLSQYYLFQ